MISRITPQSFSRYTLAIYGTKGGESRVLLRCCIIPRNVHSLKKLHEQVSFSILFRIQEKTKFLFIESDVLLL